MLLNVFDTHTHLLDEQFDQMRNRFLPTLPSLGVAGVMEACCAADDIPKVIALTALYDHVYGAAGVHPDSARDLSPAVLRRIERALEYPRMLAIGEIGLDYHYENCPRALQKDVFAAQLALAQKLHKPVLVHDRDAHGDCMDLIRAHRDGLTGVMHCYSGSYEDAVKYIDMGFYIAFGGALTFKNAKRQREIAERLPIDRLVIETDCPYMAPEPHRGERNDPSYLRYTLSVLASLRGVPDGVMASITTENARRLFGIES